MNDTTYHADGSVTVWDCYRQGWTRTSDPLPSLLATLSAEERALVMSHTADDVELEGISDSVWERVIGQQTREEFAALARDAGQDIGEAWSEALAHSAAL